MRKNNRNETEQIQLVPVGKVRSEIREIIPPDQFKGTQCTIEIFPEYEQAMEGLKDVELLTVIFYFHMSDTEPLKVHPRGDKTRPMRGVFATHSPSRPNLIGVSQCRLSGIEGRFITVHDLDAIDGTPVLDIKPCRT